MPLDRLQSDILKLIAESRSPQSVAAGGSVLHEHAFRLSDDADFFHEHDYDIVKQSNADIGILRSAGYQVELSKQHEGLVEVTVYSGDHAPTKLQWVQSGLLNFFSAIEDPTFGWRLHYADLSVNKMLAAGSRREIRDFVGTWMINKHIMPLWHAIWAAPGKDTSWNPRSLSESILRFSGFSQRDIDQNISSILDLDFGEIITEVRAALEYAVVVFDNLRGVMPGNLFVDSSYQLINNPQLVLDGLKHGSVLEIGPAHGGALPSNPSIDHEMIERVIAEYGLEGRKLLEM